RGALCRRCFGSPWPGAARARCGTRPRGSATAGRAGSTPGAGDGGQEGLGMGSRKEHPFGIRHLGRIGGSAGVLAGSGGTGVRNGTRQASQRAQGATGAPVPHPVPASPCPAGRCGDEELCRLRWYTPMPMVNGSVVADVRVRSSMPGFSIEQQRFSFNVNGYMKETEKGLQCTVGHPLKKLMDVDSPSRPLWATVDKAPVLILGGFSKNKVILLSDSDFEDFVAVEVGRRAGPGVAAHGWCPCTSAARRACAWLSTSPTPSNTPPA
uniref:Cation channel sperm associated auxiliary subunit gamma n=1 Tax=Apteryx owenii TaxID=8824 RepID=A0A8B9PN70_APTOW